MGRNALDYLLAASSDPVWVIGTFVVSMVVLHYFMIRKYPLSLKQWKLVEYIWVALALISVFSIIDDARFYKSDISIEQSEKDAMKHMNAFNNWFEVYEEYACVDNAADASFQGLCTWVQGKSSDLALILDNEEFPYDISGNFLSGLGKELSGIGEADRMIITTIHGDYLKARQLYLQAVDNAQYKGFSALMVALAPLIFAIAIALKFTKVTGEYLLTK